MKTNPETQLTDITCEMVSQERITVSESKSENAMRRSREHEPIMVIDMLTNLVRNEGER